MQTRITQLGWPRKQISFCHNIAFGLSISIALVVLVGCGYTGGTTKYFPRNDNLTDYAEIYVFRNNNVWGSALAAKVILDGFVIGSVGPGEFLRFKFMPGTHAVGLTTSSVSLQFKLDKKYYFLISVDDNAALSLGNVGLFELERITERDANKWLKVNINVSDKPIRL